MPSNIILVEVTPQLEQKGVKWANPWLARQLSGHTKRAYRTDIEQFVEWLGDMNLENVTLDKIYEYRTWLCEKGYKPATVNRKLVSLRMIFDEAVKQGILSNSPADGIRGFRGDATLFSAKKAPTEEQVTVLLDKLNGKDLLSIRDKALMYMFLGMGLRRTELMNIELGDIVEREGHMVLRVMGKGQKRRDVTIPYNVHLAVRKLISAISEAGLDTPPEITPLFQEIQTKGGYHMTGKALSTNGVYHVVTRRFAKAGIDGCTPHSCRKFFAIYLLRHGASVYNSQNALGHSALPDNPAVRPWS